MEAPPEGYRRNVGICLINDSKKIFAASRLDIPDSWQMPQGGIDEGEDPRTAAIRELREETGVQSAEILAETPHWLTYDFPPEVRAKLQKLWGSDWKGQAQKWFLLKFTGKDEEVNLLVSKGYRYNVILELEVAKSLKKKYAGINSLTVVSVSKEEQLIIRLMHFGKEGQVPNAPTEIKGI
ncbi:hypothetical protein ACLB2K_004150 [Fragaria x ananassa]